MKRYFVLISLLLFSLGVSAAGFAPKGGNGILYKKFDVSNINGDVYIFLGNMDDVQIEFSVEDSTGFSWFEYESDPADAVRLTENVDYNVAGDGKLSTLNRVKSDHGYYVEYGDEDCEGTDTCIKKYIWIATYAPIDPDRVTWDEGIICDELKLYLEPAMGYVLADNAGNKSTGSIERELKIEYSTFKEENRIPGVYEVSENHSVSAILNLDLMPYVDTDFTITDNFGVKLKSDSAVLVTDVFITDAVIAFPTMSVKNKEINEADSTFSNWTVDDLGNVIVYFSETLNPESAAEFRTSAPLSIDFVSNASPKVNRYEWHFSREENFISDFVYFEPNLNNFVFTEPGYHYIKLVVFNNINPPDDVCEYTVYACLFISHSNIWVPNVFTPNGDGVNDEFKVAYRSIESYRCRIYNQWGRKVYDSTDITKGWDGTIGGSQASIGAYFYIIDAKGTDGKVWKKRGDINLVRSK